MRRARTLVMASTLLAASLAGLGAASDASAAGQPRTVEAATKGAVIGFTDQFIAGNSWLATLAKGAELYGKKEGVKVIAEDAAGNPSTQLSQIQTFINEHVKAIIIEPVNAESPGPGIAAAKRAGIPVIVVNDLVAPSLQRQVYCNVTDNDVKVGVLTGHAVGEATIKKWPKSATINLFVMALFPKSPTTQQREKGFLEGFDAVLKANGGPKVHRIPDQYGQALPDNTLTVMRGVASGNPDINVIFNETDVVWPSVLEALEGAGLMNAKGESRNIIVGGYDGGMPEIEQMAKNPKFAMVATGLDEPATQAADAVQEAMDAIAGKPASASCPGNHPMRVVPAGVVTRANAKQFIDPALAFAGPPTVSK